VHVRLKAHSPHALHCSCCCWCLENSCGL
jgi:hypothetical protein